MLFKDVDARSSQPSALKDTVCCYTTGDTAKFSIPLRYNDYIGGMSLSFACSVTLECRMVFDLSGPPAGQPTEAALATTLVRPHPQNSLEWMRKVYPRGEAAYLTVLDLMLTPVGAPFTVTVPCH